MVKQNGGFKEAYTNQGTLKPEFAIGDKKNHSLWTAYFKSHVSEESADSILVKSLPPTENRYLYVIDMQNDFIDRVPQDIKGKTIVLTFISEVVQSYLN